MCSVIQSDWNELCTIIGYVLVAEGFHFLVFQFSLNHVWFFCDPWTVTHQAPLSIGFLRQEYWSGLPFPSPGVSPHTPVTPQRLNLYLLHWQADSLPLSYLGSPVSDSLWPHGLQSTRLFLHGIFQARILEWVAISFSRRSSQPRDWTPGLLHCRLYRFTLWATREVGAL